MDLQELPSPSKKENPARILIKPDSTTLEGTAASQVDLGASQPIKMTDEKIATKKNDIAVLKSTLQPKPIENNT